MPNVFAISEGVRTIARNVLDDLLDQLGKNCKLVYAPAQEPCADCLAPAGGPAGATWVTGGPAPLPGAGLCPACGGTGLRAVESSETIKMQVANRPAKFWVPAPANVQVPAGTIQTKAYLTDLPKIRRAEEMVLQPELAPLIAWRYRRDGEPVDAGNIVQGRYCYTLWQRA
jgi:hypothetical protein